MDDDSLPIALRRTRRSSLGVVSMAEQQQQQQQQQLPVAKTPRRSKKAVRISDPGPCSGLTPFIRRTSLGTPQHRRASTPAATRASSSTTTTNAEQALIHQTVDGRVQRRLRRSGVRDMLQKLDEEKRREVRASRDQVSALRAELKARDREIYELQNATVVIDTERIWDLEQQVQDLKEELKRRAAAAEKSVHTLDWSLANRSRFDVDEYMDYMDDDDEFGEATRAQLVCGTPSRAKDSFPTPPATSPTVPNSPCMRPIAQLQTPTSDAGIQAFFPDLEKQHLQDELASLHLEVSKLTTTLDSYKTLTQRVTDRLSTVAASDAASPVDALEAQVESLLRTMSDRTAAVEQLTSAITALGFPGEDAAGMIMSLASGFRAARLELEYLTPGEIALPLTSHGAEVLDLLLTRLRDLATRAKEDESSIDEYHDIEQSLRRQLDTRCSAMEKLKASMAKAEALMRDKDKTIQNLETGNERLKGAMDAYVRDIRELEKLVERLEQEGRDSNATLEAHRESSRRQLLEKDHSVDELQVKLAVALKKTAALQRDLEELHASKKKHINALNAQQGKALALRDARVAELRDEIDRVNESLRSAHDTICALRVDKGGLQAQMDEDKAKAKAAMDAMKEELQRALQVSQDFLATPKRNADAVPSSPLRSGSSVGKGGFLSGDLARRGSKKKLRRGYDSGLGFLDEDQVDI
ncbi:hypothetical protein B0I35DRAFT_426187 [Stachybotrys elegans]|uniref:Uncharacterized protein n=1 Tax=Stachybotrys elegans TaxID=80388 RepID=A0A8K0SVH4_9HYPO|nr:hypothetical protein B0I35DRAFT_426187 [Stachybotrys elegans]